MPSVFDMSNLTSPANAQAQTAANYTVEAFFSSLVVSFVVFGVQLAAFLLIQSYLPRI
jgi:hypothetical protein